MLTEFAQLLKNAMDSNTSNKRLPMPGASLTSIQGLHHDPYKLLLSFLRPKQSSMDDVEKKASQKSFMQNEELQSEGVNLRKVRVGVSSQMGLRNYDNMVNQDVVMMENIGDCCRVFGVFDGHGQHGQLIAQLVKTNITTLIRKYQQDLKNRHGILSLQQIVIKIIQKANGYLWAHHRQQSYHSGTTLLLLFLVSTKIIVFNVGNSRLVMAKYYSKYGVVKPFQLTHDHTLNRFDQRLRVVQSEGQIRVFRSQRGQEMGPQRIWIKDKPYPGCVVTRSLGLFCGKEIGISQEAQVTSIDTDEAIRFLVLASDGLWKVLSNEEVVDFVQKRWGENQEVIAQNLVGMARQKWRGHSDLADDISVIIVGLV